MAAATVKVAGDGIAETPRSALIFLGTGCSSAVPNLMCLIQPSDPPCHVCSQSLSLPPDQNPNYRCNTSLLIDYYNAEGKHKYILIDVGKTFWEQVFRWFTFYKIPHIDSIILTHEHADAVLGLDDIRTVQPFSATNDIDPTPIYLTQDAMQSIAVKFPYLVQKNLKPGQEIRRVAQLDWKTIENDCTKPFVASGLEFVPLPVMHGEDYVCLGFLFGKRYKVAYISDISRFPQTTESYISKDGGQQLDLLILDTLYKKGSHNTHFCFPQSLDAVKRICPKRALFIGMTHEFDHHRDNEFLEDWSKRNLDISFFVFRPTVVHVDDLVDALRQFSLYTESLGCVHSSIFRSIHGNMIIWYGAWMKRTHENKQLLSATLLSVLANVASMAILIEHSFFDAYAGESRDGSPAAKFFTGGIVSLSSATLSANETGVSYDCVPMFKDRFQKMDGATAGVCFKSQSMPRIVGLFVWKSLQCCYTYILTSEYRKTVVRYLDGFALDIKYDVFRVVYVSGDSVLNVQFCPQHTVLENEVDKNEAYPVVQEFKDS
ncbi:UNVERIFIED_CONTAM: putative hydrolase [Sesamum radiatum]|uniref:Hydrolase n=1 Tax=Sesamum radiatum TaxID=300843 RepID=A0AAW2T0A3_SESRA